MVSDAKEAASVYTTGLPTDSMGWVVAYCARRLREGLTRSFAKAGYKVSPEQWSLVAQLWQEDGLPQQTLADRFHRSKVAAFHLITKLEEQGIVVRRPNPGDGRSNLVYLTDQGRSMVRQLIPLAQGNLDRAFRGLSAEEVEQTKVVLRQMALNLADGDQA